MNKFRSALVCLSVFVLASAWAQFPFPAALFGSGTVATDPSFSSVTYLGHYDSTLTDQIGVSVTNHGTSIDTGTKKFGAGSVKFAPSGNYFTLPASLLNFGTANHTVETWINTTKSGSIQEIFRTDGYYILRIEAANNLAMFVNGGPTIHAATALSTSTWYHVALVRSGNTWTIYLNGVSDGTTTSSAAVATASSFTNIGGGVAGAAAFEGYMDDFRVTNGVARYVSNFTPPSAAFPNS